MNEFAADRGRTEGRHLDDVLRLGEFDQRAFGHRVDRDDRHPALPRLDERGHHPRRIGPGRSEEHTSELQSLMRTSYAVFCLQTKPPQHHPPPTPPPPPPPHTLPPPPPPPP